MGITEFLAQYITAFIDKTGYFSVFVLMVMESMVFPVPSEAVMPFAGFLIEQGRFSWAVVIVASTLGSIVGSLLSYWIGRSFGKPFLEKYGKFFLINKDDLAATEKFFGRFGDPTIFVCRFIPVVRHLISLPAGMAKMNIVKFSIYTIVGAGIWNAFLAWAGFKLQENWEKIMHYDKAIDMAVLLLLVAGVVYFIVKHVKRH
ncbi:MAG: DedA family protein [Chitinispirillaceae bacterium]|jgi:membrane protein DedA with SNARE-associated domain|nr:DedA family protein [Chitinispirillaceae bacterium]